VWKWASLGVALFMVGALKFEAHLAELGRQATLQDYLMMRCFDATQPGLAGASHGFMQHAVLHCWGCYAMAAGAAIMVLAGWKLVRPALAGLRSGG